MPLKDITLRARKMRAGFIGLGIKGKGEVEAFQLPTELAELGQNVTELRVYPAFVKAEAAVSAWYENAYAREGKKKVVYCIGDGEFVRWHDAKGFDPLVRNFEAVRPFEEQKANGQKITIEQGRHMFCSGSGEYAWEQCKQCKRQIAVRVYVRNADGRAIGDGYYEIRTSSLGSYQGTYGFLVELENELAGRAPITDIPLILKRVEVRRKMGSEGIRNGWDLQFVEEDRDMMRHIMSRPITPDGPDVFDPETGELHDDVDELFGIDSADSISDLRAADEAMRSAGEALTGEKPGSAPGRVFTVDWAEKVCIKQNTPIGKYTDEQLEKAKGWLNDQPDDVRLPSGANKTDALRAVTMVIGERAEKQLENDSPPSDI